MKSLAGKLSGGRGGIFRKLTDLLENQSITLITTLKKNMQPQDVFDKCLPGKRCIIESLNDQFKNIGDLEHSRRRSLSNYLSNIAACLVVYAYQDKKPTLNLRDVDLLPFISNA